MMAGRFALGGRFMTRSRPASEFAVRRLAAAVLPAFGALSAYPALANPPEPPWALGSEFTVNSFTSFGQGAASVARDQDGDFVVVWQTRLLSGAPYDIHAQRFNAAGVAQGAELPINTLTDGTQSDAAVAMDPQGNFDVVWTSYQGVSGVGDIMARRFDSNGAPLGDEFRVNTNTDTNGSQLHPAIAVDATGDFFIAFEEELPGTIRTVRGQRFTSAGHRKGRELNIDSDTLSAMTLPAVAMDDAGDVVVVWQALISFNAEIKGRRYNADGKPVGKKVIVNTKRDSNQLAPSVGMDASGNYTVAWADNGNTARLRRYGADGKPTGRDKIVFQNAAGSVSGVNIAVSKNGASFVTWSSISAAGTDVEGRGYKPDGSARGAEFTVNTLTSGGQSLPAVAGDGDGAFVVAWQSGPSAGNTDIQAQRYKALPAP